MREDGVGRVLVASLHQSIAETVPSRLPFYENWLTAGGLREGTIGLAPTYAVLSFLRQEGRAYDVITTKAGMYAAEWTVQSMPGFRRSAIRSMPVWLRGRMLLRVLDGLVRSSYAGSRAVGTVRGGIAQIDLRSSLFCAVREPVGHHLCGFYAAACTQLLALFDIQAQARVISCRGAGQPACLLTTTMLGAVSSTDATAAGGSGQTG